MARTKSEPVLRPQRQQFDRLEALKHFIGRLFDTSASLRDAPAQGRSRYGGPAHKALRHDNKCDPA